jgi:hypothetical protein
MVLGNIARKVALVTLLGAFTGVSLLSGYKIIAQKTKQIESLDRNQNISMAPVNIGSRTGIRKYVVVDENRDGTADYIATNTGDSFGDDIIFKRRNYNPIINQYKIRSFTKTMTPILEQRANEALENQRLLTDAFNISD